MPRRKYSLDIMRLPDGRKLGVKPESTSETQARLKIADRCNPVKDVIDVIPEKHWEELCKVQWHGQVRRDRYRATFDQDGIGSCAPESGTAIKSACDERQFAGRLPFILYNPWSVYWFTSGGRDNGSVIGDNVEYLRDHGVCPEEVWPRSKGWRAEPGGEAKRIAKFFRIVEFFYVETREQLVSALLQGFDVHGGYSGHAVAFNRYLGKGILEFKNSWGNWGDQGFGTLKLSNVYLPYGCYAIKNVYEWSESDWTPSLDQQKLSAAVAAYQLSQTELRVQGLKPAQGRAAERVYGDCLLKHGLAT